MLITGRSPLSTSLAVRAQSTASAAPESPPDPIDRLFETPSPRHFKFSGRPAPDDLRHALSSSRGTAIAPIMVPIPGGRYVPQYAPTIVGERNVYDPAGDCQGAFMSSRFQANNNCYNYACDVATNSFAQPGRMHGTLLGPNFTGDEVVTGAEQDGLIEISHTPMTNAELDAKRAELPPGHFVALLYSAPDAALGWPGDYHWVRQDQDGSWSQKDGTDQITNFDYAGHPISNPGLANWTVNEGPLRPGSRDDIVIDYKFHSIMYVPDSQIDII